MGVAGSAAPWRRIEMEKRFLPGRWVLVLAAGFVAAQLSSAQQLPPTYNPESKFDSGQDVVPSFDGWVHNQDGTFTMVFGYMNRNYKEELVIPAGPDNKIEPGSSDQGQATFFQTRRHAWVVFVKVPRDWPVDKELVWSLTSHGRTEKAYATLKMEYEIIPRLIQSRGGLSPGYLQDGSVDPNKPPTISAVPVTGASIGSPLTLTAVVSDDGLPNPRVLVVRPEVAGKKAQTNSAGPGRGRRGLSVTWYEYRGPAKMTFDHPEPIQLSPGGVPVTDAKAVTTATFTVPGTYVLRATANDSSLEQTADLTVTVQ